MDASFSAAPITVRPALQDEAPALEAMIVRSARLLSRDFYTDAEIEAAIEHVFGVDSDLVEDGTYLVAEANSAILGCGGWSRQLTLFGGDRFAAREPGFLDPAIDPARIRAFFVAPEAARRGVGAALLAACEDRARAAGFTRAALMATLPGVPFYRKHGYVGEAQILHPCGETSVRFVPMDKAL